ncbi:MAG TPA: hypothetical protein VMF89_35540, partial [Polyangiales bacterium]|nr:hypothetical protein [Polyangiales bacterium]
MSHARSIPGILLEPWSIVFERYVPEEEGTREALCVLGNGRFATRGATSLHLREADWHYPGTYAAG